MREIGSEFWLNNVSIKHSEVLPGWIEKWGYCVLTSSGRGALNYLLSSVEDKVINKTALLPVYICDSVINSFIRSGYACFFYDVNERLIPEEGCINSFLNKEIGIFIHMGYYGFNTSYNLEAVIKKLKKNGTMIIEDLTHTLFSYYERFKDNDYYIASLRKWIGIPSGGFVASKNNLMYKELTDHIQFYSIRKEALELKDNYINTDNRDLKSRYLDLFNQAEHILDENPNAYAIDNVSKALIQELDTQTLIKKRQSNFTFLLNSLKGISGIQPIFNELSSDSCPFFFPIYVKGERDNLRKKLINEDIYCPVHWPIPNQARLIQSSTSKEIYETIISLPCDQRYGLEEMKRLSNTLRSLFAI